MVARKRGHNLVHYRTAEVGNGFDLRDVEIKQNESKNLNSNRKINGRRNIHGKTPYVVSGYELRYPSSSVKVVAMKLCQHASLWWDHVKNNGIWLVSQRQEAFLDYHNFSQGTYTVEELINEFDRLHMRCDANEEEEQVVARFLGVLRPEIVDVWSIQKIISFVEEESKVIYDTDGNDVDESPEFKLLRPDLGESLVIHRVLSVATSKSIDDDSCENVVSSYMVEKLALKTVDHPEPYQLTSLKKRNTVKVTNMSKIDKKEAKQTKPSTRLEECKKSKPKAYTSLMGQPVPILLGRLSSLTL
ncbi:hypothetical protein Tco_1460243 [Tanacetum coccineum]